MALILVLNRNQYVEGGVRVYRGDQWAIAAQVMDRVGGVNTPRDLTGLGATAYFPAATGGGLVAAVATVSVPLAGQLSIPVDDALTPLVQENTNGIQLYVVIDATAPVTAQMLEPDLQILSRGFQQT